MTQLQFIFVYKGCPLKIFLNNSAKIYSYRGYNS